MDLGVRAKLRFGYEVILQSASYKFCCSRRVLKVLPDPGGGTNARALRSDAAEKYSSSRAVSKGSGSLGEGVRPTNFTFGDATDNAVWIGIAAWNKHQRWIGWPKLKLEGLTPRASVRALIELMRSMEE